MTSQQGEPGPVVIATCSLEIRPVPGFRSFAACLQPRLSETSDSYSQLPPVLGHTGTLDSWSTHLQPSLGALPNFAPPSSQIMASPTFQFLGQNRGVTPSFSNSPPGPVNHSRQPRLKSMQKLTNSDSCLQGGVRELAEGHQEASGGDGNVSISVVQLA